MLHTDFDPERKAFINPEDVVHPVEGMPELLVGMFSKDVVDAYVQELGGVQIAVRKSVCGDMPVWRCTWRDGTVFALVSMPLGGPAASGVIEEGLPMGAKKFLMVGCCGALDHSITAGHLLVPEAAVRDEGTSYHYLPPADEVALDADAIQALCDALAEQGVPYVRTKTWTTDAFYRETAAKIAKNKARGCAVVEMECASMAAVAKFRGVSFAQLLWAADSLAGEEWDTRNLGDHGMSAAELYFSTAIAALKKFPAKI